MKGVDSNIFIVFFVYRFKVVKFFLDNYSVDVVFIGYIYGG